MPTTGSTALALLPWLLLGVLALALTLGLRLTRDARHRRPRSHTTPAAAALEPLERSLLETRVPLFRRIPPTLRPELERRIRAWLTQIEVVGCGGLEVADEMRLVIAAQACITTLGLEATAFERASEPFRTFMLAQVRDKDLRLFYDIADLQPTATAQEAPLRVLVPAFMISELRRAFEIGFLVFVPFLVLDMVVASVLMSMGMMMLPPVIMSLPFKLVFFVLVDGWYLVVGSLVESFNPV